MPEHTEEERRKKAIRKALGLPEGPSVATTTPPTVQRKEGKRLSDERYQEISKKLALADSAQIEAAVSRQDISKKLDIAASAQAETAASRAHSAAAAARLRQRPYRPRGAPPVGPLFQSDPLATAALSPSELGQQIAGQAALPPLGIDFGGFARNLGVSLAQAGAQFAPPTEVERLRGLIPPLAKGGLGTMAGAGRFTGDIATLGLSELPTEAQFKADPGAAAGRTGLIMGGLVAGQVLRDVVRGGRHVVRKTLKSIEGKRLVPDLPDFEDMARAEFKDDIWRTIVNVKGVREIMRGMVSASAVAKDVPTQAQVLLTQANAMGRQFAEGELDTLIRIGNPEDLFGPEDAASIIMSGRLKGKTLDHIRRFPDQYDLDTLQREWVDQGHNLHQAMFQRMEDNGIKMPKRILAPGERHVSRRVMGREIDGEILEYGSLEGPQGSKELAKAFFEEPQLFASKEEGIAEGYRYLTDVETMEQVLKQGYKRIAQKRHADYVLSHLDPHTWATMGAPAQIVTAAETTHTRYLHALNFRAALKKAVRGEEIDPAELRAIGRSFPKDKKALEKIVANKQALRLAAARVAAPPTAARVADVPTAAPTAAPIGAEAFVLPRELAGAKPNYNIGMTRYTPQFESDLDKALFIVSQTKKSARDESYMVWLRAQLPDLSDTQLREAGRKVRTHIKGTVRGQPEGNVPVPISRAVREALPDAPTTAARPTTTAAARVGEVPVTPVTPVTPAQVSMGRRYSDMEERADELVKRTKKDYDHARSRKKKAIASAEEHAKERGLKHAYTTKGGDKKIIAAFGGVQFDKEVAKAISDGMDDQLILAVGRNKFGRFLRATDMYSEVARYFLLAGDFSLATIQLAFLAFANPAVFGKSMFGMVRAFRDPDFMRMYINRPENALIRRQNPELILPMRVGGEEMTKAFGRTGLLGSKLLEHPFLKHRAMLPVRGALVAPRKILEPFARAFDHGQVVAGVELRKSLAPLVVDTTTRHEVNEFINVFRGLYSSERRGVSLGARRNETRVFLAPRYGRAMASLAHMLARGGVQGSVARRHMGQGAAGIVALMIALESADWFHEGRRGDLDERLQRLLDPTSGANFMTLNVAGQRMGVGTKFRSVIKLYGDLYKAQARGEGIREAASAMWNPALRWMRGQTSPAVGTLIDLTTGKNYGGDPMWGSSWLPTHRVITQNFLPISIQSMVLEGGSLKERAMRGAVEFVGGRTGEQGAYDLLDQTSMEMWGLRLNEIPGSMRKEVMKVVEEEYDEKQLAQVMRGDPYAIYFSKRKELDQERYKAEQALADRIGSPPYAGSGMASRIQSQYRAINHYMAGRVAQLNIDHQMYQDDNDFDENDENKLNLEAWYDAYTTSTRADLSLDFRKLEYKHAELVARWTPEQIEYIVRETNTTEHPPELMMWLSRGTQTRIRMSQQARESFLKKRRRQ